VFAVYYGARVEGFSDANVGFPPADAAAGQTVERPVVLAGRLAHAGRADEVEVSQNFINSSGERVGDILTVDLSSPAQASAGFDARSDGTPRGPRVRVRIVWPGHRAARLRPGQVLRGE
jgi:hypothetical protein